MRGTWGLSNPPSDARMVCSPPNRIMRNAGAANEFGGRAVWGNRETGEQHTCAWYFWQDVDAPYVVDIPEAGIRIYLSEPAAVGMIEIDVDDQTQSEP
jgi:hypothetical protein